VWTPRILKDGSDGVGALGALNRVYINIGLFSEEWLLHFRALIGGRPISPIPIATAQKNSVYWQATELQTPNMARFFLASTDPHYLKDAPGGANYLRADATTLERGKVVFAERCARCHSSKTPDLPTGLDLENANGPNYLAAWNRLHGTRNVSLRFANVYGPRQLIKHNRQGFIGWFIRLAIEGREIQIFGDGSQLRDFVFVDDAADAFLRAGASDVCDGGVFNVGGTEPIAHRDLVRVLIDVAGTGRVTYVPWPPEKKQIDIGSFYSDSSKFMATSGWAPQVALREGFERTIAFYRAHLPQYLEAS